MLYIYESIYKTLLALHIWQNSYLNSHRGLTPGGAVPHYLNKKGRASPGTEARLSRESRSPGKSIVMRQIKPGRQSAQSVGIRIKGVITQLQRRSGRDQGPDPQVKRSS